MNTVYLNRDSSKGLDDAHHLNGLISKAKNLSPEFVSSWHAAYQHYCATQEAIVLEQGGNL